jgi:cysteine desulfurase
MKRIYLDNCLTTKPDPEVINAMMPYLTDRYFFPGNFVSTGSNAKKALLEFKTIIADSIGAYPDEIHLTAGGTSANNIGIKGYIMANHGRGNHIICSQIDYPDILTNAAFFEESGFEVTYLTADIDGFINLDELKSSINKNTILVMTTMANHVLGTIQPIKKIREIMSEKNPNTAIFCDACEAFGRMQINVNDLGIDMLSLSAHKIHGPQGAGALYVRKGTALAQTKHGINRIDEFDTGGLSMANLAGMSKAIEIQFRDLDTHISHIKGLQTHLLKGIEERIGKVSVNGTLGIDRICNNLNISIEEVEGEALTMLMDIAGITVATGSACASQGLKPNYVMMAVGKSFTQSHGSMKFTLSRLNTKEEIDFVIEKFCEAVTKLRKMSPFTS